MYYSYNIDSVWYKVMDIVKPYVDSNKELSDSIFYQLELDVITF